MTKDQQDEIKEPLHEAAWLVVRASTLYRDQLLENGDCDAKADELTEYLHAKAIDWIIEQECAEAMRRTAHLDETTAVCI